jgi:hypothetical protein
LEDSLSDKKFEPHKITKPIQLLATWFLSLIIIDSIFLYVARDISKPSWGASALIIAAIAFVPMFAYIYFHLQTRYRIEMQEDAYYSKYILSTLSAEDIEEKHVEEVETELMELNAKEGIESELSLISSQKENYDNYISDSINFEQEVFDALLSTKSPFKANEIRTNVLLRKADTSFVMDAIIESNNVAYVAEIKASKSRWVCTRAAHQLVIQVEAYRDYAVSNNMKFSIRPILILPHDIKRVGNTIYGIPVLKYDRQNKCFTNVNKLNL